MRLRKLQRLNEDSGWFDDAYAYEDQSRRVVFCYNIAWGRIGAKHATTIRDQQISLEKIELVIPQGPELRWLPIEDVANDQKAVVLEELNQACDILLPQSQPDIAVTT